MWVKQHQLAVCVVLSASTPREVFYEAQACAVAEKLNRHYKASYYLHVCYEESHLAAVTSYSIGKALFDKINQYKESQCHLETADSFQNWY